MNREYHRWYSPVLERDMELLVFGSAGPKVLVFPTRDGRFWEYEDLRVVECLKPRIEAGEMQLYCIDSLAHESFYCFWSHPTGRIRRHLQYEEYVLGEVLPFMQKANPHPEIISHGLSLGAYHAVNIALRHPHLFTKVRAFSGRYDLTLAVEHFTDLLDGFYDQNVYENTPSHFVYDLDCTERLSAIRRMDIVLTIGDEDPFLENNRQLIADLESKGAKPILHVWEGRAHRGGAWRRMAPQYL